MGRNTRAELRILSYLKAGSKPACCKLVQKFSKFQKQQNNLLFSVTNTGKGIPAENIDRVFDRFYRIDESRTRKSGGYGLGLAIAKTIVEQHGGKISVKSIPDESTTFYIKLPDCGI